MDLLILSQDKMNLVKVNQVNVNYQNNNQIIANYIPDFIGTQGGYYELLGTYESKERALEVLDEIKSIICINCGFVLYSNIGKFPNNYNKEYNLVPVFEMPEK